MTLEQVKNLRGGDLIQSKDAERYPAIAVILDKRVCKDKNPQIINVQWIGGGCSIMTLDYNGWQNLQVINNLNNK